MCRETRGREPLLLLPLLQRGDEDAAPKREDGTGPGDEAEGCPRSQSAIRRERGRHNQLVDKQ